MNNLQINPDDPKWTAYVLGELDEAERLEIERLIETSGEARALVDELNLAAMTLKVELTPLGAFAMTPEQKAAIRQAAEPTPSRWFALFPMKWGWGLAGAAAVVLLAVTPLWIMKRGPSIEVSPIDKVAENRTEAVAPNRDSTEQSQLGEDVKRALADRQSGKLQTPRGQEQTQGRIESDERKDLGVLNEERAPKADSPPTPPATQVTAGNGTGLAGGVLGGQIDNPALVGAAPGAVRQKEEAEAAEAFLKAVTLPVVPAAAPGATPGARGGGGGRGAAAPANAGQGQQGQGGGQGQQGAIVPGFSGQLIARDGLSALAAAPPPPPPPPPAAPARALDRIYVPGPNTESYDRIVDNPFIRTTQENLPTFSIDVDTASYANVRRFLTQNQMPPRDAVRIEEMINYFTYDYAQPTGRDPIAPNMELAAAPWNPANRLLRIGIKAREINADRRPPSNLVFLIDVSGSMNQPAKLPLVKAGLKMLVDRLGENDMVSIVVYAGASGLVLPPTSAARKERIQQSIDSLRPGGSTNGASGIRLAYDQAVANFIKGGTNRVILMTDGDFNVGVTNQGDLTRLIEERAKSGVFLSVLGFGMGNLKDSTMEKLADQGNGNYAYIDSLNEARKVLVEQMGGTLVTVAKDVKIQVDFNPGRVEAYRLIGYENRILRTEDFNNDLKDAGDMGAGHTVTALFEVVPKGGTVPGPSIDPSKYTAPAASAAAPVRPDAASSNEMLTLRVRYKQPDGDTSTKMDVPLVDQNRTFARATSDFRFAAAVAEFGMILRESPYRGNASMDSVLDLAEGSRGQDRSGYRQEFIELVQRAKRLR